MTTKPDLRVFLEETQYLSQSYQIYGGSSGYQDYGLMGARLKAKLLDHWRYFFVSTPLDTVFEVDTPSLVPYPVLKASGHVDRFTDYVIQCEKDTEYRADHFVKNWCEQNNRTDLLSQVEQLDENGFTQFIQMYQILSVPFTIYKKNLMFEILQTNSQPFFLRPEQAQNIVTNFASYSKFLKKDLPWGIAQIGKSYRKEIACHSFTRLREFSQAELEYFVDPQNKLHKYFSLVSDLVVPLLTAEMQSTMSNLVFIKLGDAVSKSLISTQVMAYFIGRTFQFAHDIGLKDNCIRFRQHQSHELSHYALDCWDLETLVSGSWLECVGLADRGDYDLTMHMKQSGVDMRMKRPNTEKLVPRRQFKLNFSQVKKACPANLTKNLIEQFEALDESILNDVLDGNNFALTLNDQSFILTNSMLNVTESKVAMSEEYVPHIVESSFGIDRLIYSVLEQNIWMRDDQKRIVLSLPKLISPYVLAVFTLSKKPELEAVLNTIVNNLHTINVVPFLDDSSVNIGKKYVRSDQLGIQYAITIDFDSLQDNQITVRERDTMKQNRYNINDLTNLVKNIIL